MIGKDELKAWMIARATKPITLLLYRHQSGSRKSNSSQRQRYQKEAITAAIGSGTTAVVAAAMGDNSSGDFSDMFWRRN